MFALVTCARSALRPFNAGLRSRFPVAIVALSSAGYSTQRPPPPPRSARAVERRDVVEGNLKRRSWIRLNKTTEETREAERLLAYHWKKAQEAEQRGDMLSKRRREHEVHRIWLKLEDIARVRRVFTDAVSGKDTLGPSVGHIIRSDMFVHTPVGLAKNNFQRMFHTVFAAPTLVDPFTRMFELLRFMFRVPLDILFLIPLLFVGLMYSAWARVGMRIQEGMESAKRRIEEREQSKPGIDASRETKASNDKTKRSESCASAAQKTTGHDQRLKKK